LHRIPSFVIMIRFKKTTSYSLLVLSHIAKYPSRFHTASSLSEELKIPGHYLRTVLTSLAKKKIIVSRKGRGGGINLRKPASQIMLWDIIVAVEGKKLFLTCVFGFSKCPLHKQCQLHEIWADSKEKMIKLFSSITLSDFAEKQ